MSDLLDDIKALCDKHTDETIYTFIREKLGMRNEVCLEQYYIPNCLETYQLITNSNGCTKSLVLSFFINKELYTEYAYLNIDDYRDIRTLEQFTDKLKIVLDEYKFNLIKSYQLGCMFNMLFIW